MTAVVILSRNSEMILVRDLLSIPKAFSLPHSPPVLVLWTAIIKIPQAEWLLNHRNSFLTVLAAGKSKIKMLADSASGYLVKACLLFTNIVSLVCPHMAEGYEGALWGVFIRALILFLRAAPSWPNHTPKASSPNASSLGVKISHMNFGTHSPKI